MKCGIFAFTEKGKELRATISQSVSGERFRKETLEVIDYLGKEDVDKAFKQCKGLVFIGATGIAVRLIAPFLKDKLTDPAVIVIDEMANFVIPIASGHVGGANELAMIIADKIGAIPVITTATDVNDKLAIDELAVANELSIVNRDNIKKVSAKLLVNEPVNMAICDDVIITSDADEVSSSELGLIYKPISIGIGCRRGKSSEELSALVNETLLELNIDKSKIIGISSIDLKKDEPGLIELAEELSVPFVTFSSDELLKVEGEFDNSDFVEKTVGVGDVSARSAKALGKHGKFLIKKKKKDGMTISVYEKYKRITLGYEKA